MLGLVESRTSAAARAGLVARTGLVAARTHAAAASIGDGGLRAAAGALQASSRAHLGVAQKAAAADVVGGFLAAAIGVALVSFGESVGGARGERPAGGRAALGLDRSRAAVTSSLASSLGDESGSPPPDGT